jgi:hypothetical protein
MAIDEKRRNFAPRKKKFTPHPPKAADVQEKVPFSGELPRFACPIFAWECSYEPAT